IQIRTAWPDSSSTVNTGGCKGNIRGLGGSLTPDPSPEGRGEKTLTPVHLRGKGSRASRGRDEGASGANLPAG
ncbi:MAG TPA: hypothetical protein P5179_12005, partial [Candidatus Latescibacteria bacterium]|nr:hypothetical protein [Candidatus Latescibacterota bacterium]